MTIKYEIEYKLPNGEDEYLNVEFSGKPDYDSGAVTYSYGSQTITENLYPSFMVENISWDEDKFTYDQNTEIKKWLNITSNYSLLEDKFYKDFDKKS